MSVEQQEALYGKDIKEWLKRWDSGDTVWSIEMGGLGPGYEQAIQITVAENVRVMIDTNFDSSEWKDKEKWERDRDIIEKAAFANKTIDDLGLTGAMFGAALNLATMLYSKSPIGVFTDERVKDRHIQVNKSMP